MEEKKINEELNDEIMDGAAGGKVNTYSVKCNNPAAQRPESKTQGVRKGMLDAFGAVNTALGAGNTAFGAGNTAFGAGNAVQGASNAVQGAGNKTMSDNANS